MSKHASSGALGVSEIEATKVVEELKSISIQSIEVGKTSRTQYAMKERMLISCCSSLHGYRQSVRHFANECPQLNKSSIWCSTLGYKFQLVQQQMEEKIFIGLKYRRPNFLSYELNAKLRTAIQNKSSDWVRKSSALINIHTMCVMLAGLVCSDVEKYGQYLDF